MESAAVLAGAPILEHPAATISRTIQTAIAEAVQTEFTEAVANLIPILRKANPVLIVARRSLSRTTHQG
jgi:hypothetical protein